MAGRPPATAATPAARAWVRPDDAGRGTAVTAIRFRLDPPQWRLRDRGRRLRPALVRGLRLLAHRRSPARRIVRVSGLSGDESILTSGIDSPEDLAPDARAETRSARAPGSGDRDPASPRSSCTCASTPDDESALPERERERRGHRRGRFETTLTLEHDVGGGRIERLPLVARRSARRMFGHRRRRGLPVTAIAGVNPRARQPILRAPRRSFESVAVPVVPSGDLRHDGARGALEDALGL